MLGGGGGGGSGLIGELLGNAEQIGNGIAAIMASTKGVAPNGSAAPAAPVAVAGTPQKALPSGQQGDGQRQLPPAPEASGAHLDTLVLAVQHGDDQTAVNAFVDVLKTFDSADEPFPTLGRRILSGFGDAEDEGEIYTVVKGLFVVTSRPVDRITCKAIAQVLARWYAVIHANIFGASKQLMDGSSTVQPETAPVGTGTEEVVVEEDESEDDAAQEIQEGAA